MSDVRLAALPADHLYAEMVAHPLASVKALELALTSLDTAGPREPRLQEATLALWRDAEREIGRAFPAHSLDELVAVRDLAWFGAGAELRGAPLATHLRRAARRLLAPGGATCRPANAVQDGPSARMAWRWMSLALPSDLLAAAIGCPGGVQQTEPLVDRLLQDKGYAEVHLHVDAALDFGSLWVIAMKRIASVDVGPDAFRVPGGALGDGKDLGAWLLRTALARVLLAQYLAPATQGIDFLEFIDRQADGVQAVLGVGSAVVLQEALADLRTPGRPLRRDEYRQLQVILRLLDGTAQIGRKTEPEELGAHDPISAWLGGGNASEPETQLVMRGFQRLSTHPTDAAFAATFWQVVRVRCLLFRHVVQRPMTPGLQWFIRFFQRLEVITDDLPPRLKLALACMTSGRAHGLRSLEARKAPSDSQANVLRWVRAGQTVGMEERKAGRMDFELGLVFHLPRARGGGWESGGPAPSWTDTDVSPATGNTPFRHGGHYLALRSRAMALGRCLVTFPRSLIHARGIDLCNDEAGIPSWVVAPLLRYLRRAGQGASEELWAGWGLRVPPLRTTIHVGEDWAHLLTGMRRLGEALSYLGLQEGDRLGHALCLGVHATEWSRRAGRVFLPREDRLADLLWELRAYTSGLAEPPEGRLEKVRYEATEHSEHIWHEGITLRELERITVELHDEELLRAQAFPTGPLPRPMNRQSGLVQRFLTDQGIFERGRETVDVDVREEAEALGALQLGLRRDAARRHLVVELNPTSNLLIGHLADVTTSPLWGLCQRAPTLDAPALSVCVGSDDPVTFGTSLPAEYQLMMDVALQCGVEENAAIQWIERVRATGMSARFTLTTAADLDVTTWGRPGLTLPLPP